MSGMGLSANGVMASANGVMASASGTDCLLHAFCLLVARNRHERLIERMHERHAVITIPTQRQHGERTMPS